MVLTVLLVRYSMIDRGVEKDPLLRKPRARSVEEAVTPLAKLYVPPEEEPLRTPVPVVPAARVVAVVPAAQSDVVPTLKPVGSVAVALVPMPSKFSGIAVPVEVMLNWAYISGHTMKSIPINNRYNFLIVHFGFKGTINYWLFTGTGVQAEITTSKGFFGGGTVLCQRYKPFIIQMLPFSGNYKKYGLINILM